MAHVGAALKDSLRNSQNRIIQRSNFWLKKLRIRAKSIPSDNLKVDQNSNLARDRLFFSEINNHVSICSFGPLSSWANVHFGPDLK